MNKYYCFECDTIHEVEEELEACPWCGTEDIMITDINENEYEAMKGLREEEEQEEDFPLTDEDIREWQGRY